jgi:hypothetical protein
VQCTRSADQQQQGQACILRLQGHSSAPGNGSAQPHMHVDHQVATDARGEAVDVLLYSRLFSYSVLGFCATSGSLCMFQLLGIQRSQ